MKVCAISDLHGNLISVNKSDILFICGDIVPLYMQRNVAQSLKWFKADFLKWYSEQPVNQIYMVGGNHDFFLEKYPQECKECTYGTNITLLYDEGAEYYDEPLDRVFTIWGSPLCHQFGNWAFMPDKEYQEEKFSLIPTYVDFLITHDAAYGRNDTLLDKTVWWADGSHIGNPELAKALETRFPSYHFTGHLHSTDHNLVDYNGTKTACVSILDEGYKITYQPLYLKI